MTRPIMTRPIPRKTPVLRAALGVCALSLAGWGLPALSQTASPAIAPDQSERISAAEDCPAPDTIAQPATSPDASEDATAPENTGTTGWSGGTGGSQLGTNTQGAVESSPTWQPPTARGLDLAGLAEPVPQC